MLFFLVNDLKTPLPHKEPMVRFFLAYVSDYFKTKKKCKEIIFWKKLQKKKKKFSKKNVVKNKIKNFNICFRRYCFQDICFLKKLKLKEKNSAETYAK